MSYNFITKMSLQGRGERKGRGGRKESEKKKHGINGHLYKNYDRFNSCNS